MSTEEAAVAAAQAAAGPKRPKTEYEKVTMSDGRTVEFPKNRKLSKQSFITGVDNYNDAAAVRLDYANGETRMVYIPGASIIADLMGGIGAQVWSNWETDNMAGKLQHLLKAATHGYEQKLGDEMAYQPKKDEPEPTLEDKIEWVDELIGRLQGLEWTVAREGGGLAGAGILVQALVALSGKSKEEIREFLKPASKEERAAIKRTSPVKEKIEEIEAELAKKNGIDGGALLGKLGLAAAPPAN
jgi:hypothetical protein